MFGKLIAPKPTMASSSRSSDAATSNSLQPSNASTSKSTRPWWQNVVCYQIWPMSFLDSNSDGIGDIRGIISKLPCLKDLGIDLIWLSPTYASPLADYGYDVSDYQDICPQFGTMLDMDELIQEVHRLGMQIILDLVVTHTSDQHAWFKESRRSRDNEKSDWYIWKDRRKTHHIFNPVANLWDMVEEPTNWRACFGDSAWTYVPERDQYYLNLFMSAEPDLNWELPHVRQAIYDEAIGFWLEKGIDGFRIDTVNRISKDWNWPDAPVKLEGKVQPASEFYIHGLRSHEFLQEMCAYMENHARVKERCEPLMLVGELPSTDYERVLKYVTPESKELSMVFDFDMVKLGGHDNPDEVKPHEVKNLCDGDPSFTLPLFKRQLQKVQNLIADGGWGTIFMEKDQSRSVPQCPALRNTHLGYCDRAAKLLCLLQTTLSGTQFIYQGQEIGMRNMPPEWDIHDFRDPAAINYIKSEQQKAVAETVWDPEEQGWSARRQAERGVLKFGRDNGRTPVQWSRGKHAGFSDIDDLTWIGVNHNYKRGINVEDQQKDNHSIWHFWKARIAMRKLWPEIFMHGKFEILEAEDEELFAYTKTADDGRMAVVVLNFSETQRLFPWKPSFGQIMYCVAGSIHDSDLGGTSMLAPARACLKPLRAWEGRILLVRSPEHRPFDLYGVGYQSSISSSQ